MFVKERSDTVMMNGKLGSFLPTQEISIRVISASGSAMSGRRELWVTAMSSVTSRPRAS